MGYWHCTTHSRLSWSKQSNNPCQSRRHEHGEPFGNTYVSTQKQALRDKCKQGCGAWDRDGGLRHHQRTRQDKRSCSWVAAEEILQQIRRDLSVPRNKMAHSPIHGCFPVPEASPVGRTHGFKNSSWKSEKLVRFGFVGLPKIDRFNLIFLKKIEIF
jgi:hypothetical protein